MTEKKNAPAGTEAISKTSGNNIALINYGATDNDWLRFDVLMGLTQDLLPVVSRPDAKISPGSSINTLGKVPSRFNHAGMVSGFIDWSKKVATRQEIDAWSKNPDLGICIQTRHVRALDIDVTDAAQAAEVEAVIGRHLPGLPKRYRANSSKFLVAFRLDGEYVKSRFSTSGGAVEFLATGQQFVAAGTHPSGSRYTWNKFDDFPTVTPEAFEALWAELVATFANGDETRGHGKPRRIGDDLDIDDPVATFLFEKNLVLGENNGKLVIECPWGDQHTTGATGDGSTVWFLAGTNGHQVGHFDCRHTHCAGRHRGDYLAAIGYQESDVDVFDTIDGPVEFDMNIDRTDTGNVNLLAKQTDGNLRFVYETRTWLTWNGHGWIEDHSGSRAVEATRKVADYYFDKATEIRKGLGQAGVDDTARKGIEKAAASFEAWAMQCRNKPRIDAMLDLAKRDRRFEITFDQLNRDPFLLGVANGVVDLRTGKLREASREEFVTKRSPYAYKPDAAAVRWVQFIDEITGTPIQNKVIDFERRPDLADYIQKAIGYSITGSTAEQVMFICHGSGSNGKNVILDMMTRLFGDHVLTINPEALMATKYDADGERATPVARQLAGARMAICSESRNTHQLDVATVKKHTGGGFMSARALHQAPINFEISHKVWLMTNHVPSLDHMDDAMRGRLHLIPFDRRWNRPGVVERDETLPDGDKTLPDKLKREAEGILAWVVAGAVRYCADGLAAPEIVTQSTTEYFQEQDGFNAWLNSMVRIDDPNQGLSASAAREHYVAWCKSHGRGGADISVTAFGRRLGRANVAKTKYGSIFYAIRAGGLSVGF